MQEVVDDDRLENVEFEVALRAGESDGSGGAVYLHADHRLGGTLRELGMRVQPRSDRGSADGEVVEAVERLLQALDVALQQTGPAAELLPEGQGDGVLQVRAADLYYVAEFLRFGRDRVVNALDRRNQRFLHAFRRRDVHGSRERIV